MPTKKLTKSQIAEIFRRFEEKSEAPAIELDYQNPYELLVAVVLSAQATDKGVNKVTPHLFLEANTPELMIKLGEEGLKNHIKSIGLYNAKAKNIIALSHMLINKYGSCVPSTLEDLMQLPGVGRKSANVMLNSIFGQHTIAVDTHVFRTSNRIGFCDSTTPLATELALMNLVPKQYMDRAHHWLVLHGRYICKARRPLCENCLIDDICKFKHKRYGKTRSG